MTNEEVTGAEGAYEKVRYYIQRWKIGRFHHVLKSGREIEELRERTMEKMKTLILMYSGKSGIHNEPDLSWEDKS